MKTRRSFGWFALVLLLLPAAHARAAQTTHTLECTAEQGKAAAVTIQQDEAAQHRRFQVPAIDYPFGTKLEGEWGQSVALRVNAEGGVTCYTLENNFGRDHPPRPQVARALAGVAQWRYAPFLRGGKPVATIVREHIAEQELPAHEIAMPSAPPGETTVTLRRTECYGTCPNYAVQIRGDGHVLYVGFSHVQTTGKHEYAIPVTAVSQLLDDIRAKNLWSLRDSYADDVSDLPSTMIEIRVGTQTHWIRDYMGTAVGMPRAVNEIESEIDRVADTARWIGKPPIR